MRASRILLVAGLGVPLFLAPIVGGQVAAEPRPLPSSAPGLIGAVLSGEAPTTLHLLLGLLVLAALIAALLRSKVVQVPAAKLAAPAMLFFGIALVTALNSDHRSSTLAALAEWGVYVAAFFASVALSGRRSGPRLLAAMFVAGCVAVSLKGLLEYGAMRPIDPSWRIFAGWVNANALAGILLMGLPIAAGLAVAGKRLEALAWGVCAALIGLALLLTQSKGGLMAGAAGFGAFVLAALVRVERAERVRTALRLAATLASIAAVGALLIASQRGATGPPSDPGSGGKALGRVMDVSGTEAQSFAFRRNLWDGTVKNISQNPLGTGLGTYRFHSAKAGLTPQTHYAHQLYLQIASEASPLAAAALLLFCVVWLGELLRRDAGLPHAARVLRMAILGAVLGSGVHCLFDSDWYQFGIGFSVFALMGVGSQLSADAVTPEFVRRGWRVVALAALALGVVGSFMASLGELAVGRLAGALADRDLAGAQAALKTAETFAASDGDTWRFAALIEPSADRRIQLLERAALESPTPKNYRALASALNAAGQPERAQAVLGTALTLDPNNLAALKMRMDLRRASGDEAAASEDALRLVRIENTPYFSVRALPEFVPTETFAARRYLASIETDPSNAVSLLRPAVEGMLAYAARTVPTLKQHVEAGVADPSRLLEAADELDAARRDAERLAEIYRGLGRSSEVAETETWASTLGEAAAGLPRR